ncbi:unnamed protein product [Allacma fusca]|uniref:Secreted protein n=1 Tax=Allacma fusca TaxID=39272 RepID=A0A8J2K1D9_9HEXA|nr:unnamed protein product [Allacma fusca]
MNHWLPLECFIVAVLSLAVASDCEVATAEPSALCDGCDGLEECRVDYARKQVLWPKGLSKSRKTDGVGLHSSNDEPHPRHGPATEIEDFRNNNYIRANESGSEPGKPCQQYNEVKHCMQKQNIKVKTLVNFYDRITYFNFDGTSLLFI